MKEKPSRRGRGIVAGMERKTEWESSQDRVGSVIEELRDGENVLGLAPADQTWLRSVTIGEGLTLIR
jgi:hypothetical protein